MAAFQPGDLVVYRVGDGNSSLTSAGTAVFLDEYTTSGTLVQSIALPTAVSGSNHRLVESGTATSEGELNLSADGRYLVLTGYDAALGTVSVNSQNPVNVARVVGLVDGSGNVDTTTALGDAETSGLRAATSTDGTNIWISGNGGSSNGGIRYTTHGSTTSAAISTTITNTRDVVISDGQLYETDSSGSVRVGQVGTGLPTTSGQTITNLPGIPTNGSPYGIFFADLSSSVAGVDTLYVADDTASGGQVQKYSLVGSNWMANGAVADTAVRGLTGSVSDGHVTLFTTTGGSGSTGGGSLDTFTDTSGYNATITGTLTHLASASPSEAFRGVAFAPSAPDTTAPTVQSIAASDPNPTAAGSAHYTVTFSEAVTGVDTTDFALVTTGGVSGAAVTAVSGSGTTWTVTVGTGSGDGTVALNLVDDDSIKDGSGNALGGTGAGNGNASGPAYTVDHTAPALASASPAEGATGVAAGSNIVLTFSEAVQAGSGTITITDGAADTRTVAVTDASQVTVSGTTVTINPVADLKPGDTYHVTADAGIVTDAAGNASAPIGSGAVDFSTQAAAPAAPTVDISQIYGGGGNSGAPYTNDFIELYNYGSAAVTLDGWSVQYASSSGTSWQVTDLSGSILPGHYYLVQEAVGSNTSATALPTPDATGTIPMSSTAGKVALSSSTTAFSGATPSGSALVDFVGFGAANSYEGSGAAPAPSNTTADARNDPATDTNNNASDFAAVAPNPHNSSFGSGPATPTVSISNASVVEGDSGTKLMSFTVTRSDTTTAFTVDYATADGTATIADNDYVATSGTLTFAAGGPASQTISVTINGDTKVESNETFSVNLSTPINSTGSTTLGTGSATGTIVNDDFTLTHIYDIQGSGNTSPYVGQTVTTQGVVTAISTGFTNGVSNGASKGFYIQDVNGDGNAATSDGVFVYTGSAPTVHVGDLVDVTGTVQEYTPSGADTGSLSTTEIGAVTSITTVGTHALPTAVLIGDAGIHLPTSDIAAANALYESLEGMLVTVDTPLVVGPTNGYGEIFTVASNGVDATGLNSRGDLLISGGAPNFGNTDSQGTSPTGTTGDQNPERIQIDPGLGVALPSVSTGAHLSSVTGIVGYDFGDYQVMATSAPTVTQASPLTKAAATLTGDATHLLVASYNTENLDPGDGAARFAQVASEILTKLNAPDVVALQEIQDNNGTADNGVTAADQTLSMIVNALNSSADKPAGATYAYIDNPFIGDGTNGGQPDGNIRTAFVYRTDHVSLVAGSLATIAADGSAIHSSGNAATDAAANSDQQTDINNPFYASRPPLSATFTFNGQDVTILSDHFTSKGGSDALYGSDQPPFDAGEVSRAAQAQAVNTYVDGLLAQNPNAKVLVAGDLNDFGFEEPLTVLKGQATITNYHVPGSDPITATATYTPGGTQVLNDLQDTLPADQRFDYVYEGNAETLDHMLATNALASGAQFQPVHINSEFYDQTSDHDPLIGRFAVGAAPTPLAAGSIAFTGFNADGVDSLAFVALTTIAAGTVIRFTDNNWSGTAFGTTESTWSWTAGATVAAGTVVSLGALNSASPTSSVGSIAYAGTATPDIADNNEAVYAYLGDIGSPTTFLTALANTSFSSSHGGVLTGTGLVAGQTALAFPATGTGSSVDIAAYSGATGGRAGYGDYLSLLNNPANWVSQNATGDQSHDGINPDLPFATTPFTLDPNAQKVSFTDDTVSVSHNEGDAGTTTTYTFTVQRTNGTTGDLSFSGTFGAGTTNAADYGGTLPPATFSGTIAAGSSTAPVTITVSGDRDFEPDETFSLTLNSATNNNASTGAYVAGNTVATGTIVNDDPVQTIAFSADTTAVSHPEGNSGTTVYTFTVVRSGSTTGDLAFTGTLTPGSGIDASDFGGTLPATFTGTIPDGQSSATVSINVSGDTQVENDDAFTLKLTGGSNSQISVNVGANATATGTIVNDDFVIHTGETNTVSFNLTGNDHLLVQHGGTAASQINWVGTNTAVELENDGLVQGGLGAGTVSGMLTVVNHGDGEIDAINLNGIRTGATFEIDNDGLIQGNGVLALRIARSGGATGVVNNNATGVITSTSASADVISWAAGTTINNSGKIISADDTPTVNGGSAVDFNSGVGNVFHNLAGGLVEGSHHAVTGKVGLTVTNDQGGTMIGRNGSAVNIDNDGTVANTVFVTNHGDMEGRSAGYADSDGDAVDVDGLVQLDNYGTVQGLGANGTHDGGANVSEGAAIGGGVVNNYAGATIYGYGRAIQVDNSAEGPALGATTIYNEGTIKGDGNGPTNFDPGSDVGIVLANREAIDILGSYADTITNKGTIVGGVFTDGGDDVFNAYAGSSVSKLIDLGDGNDTVTLNAVPGGATTGTFGTPLANVEHLNVVSGNWSVTTNKLASNIDVLNGAAIVGQGLSLDGDRTLTVEQGGLVQGSASGVYVTDTLGVGAPTIINNGTIKVVAAATKKYDTIQINGSTATIHNGATGVIDGVHHAITGTLGITVTNDAGGLIVGHNGSAVNMDNTADPADTAYITNYGTMLGDSANTSDSDGDAIDVDGLLSLVNGGTIRGEGASGTHDGGANVSEGVAIGGGNIQNLAGGTIYGYGRAIQVDDSANGPALGATTIYNEGTIQGDGHGPQNAAPGSDVGIILPNREAIDILGSFADTITNKGVITGGVFMDGGDDVFNAFTGSSVSGLIDGGDGNDAMNLDGAGNGTLGAVVNFETLDVAAGTWTLSAAESYANGTTIQAGAAVIVGAAGSLGGAIDDEGTLTFAHDGDITASGAISGAGSLVKAGSGTLVLAGANSFGGGTTIASGTLELAAAGAAGTGGITFTTGAGTLRIDAPALDAGHGLANTIMGFAADGDALDFAGIAAGSATVAFDYGSDRLTLIGTEGSTLAQIQLAGSYVGQGFAISDDGQGGTKVVLGPVMGTPSVTVALAADTGLSASDGITNSAALTGTVDPLATVSFTDEMGRFLGSVAADAQGTYTFAPTGLGDGPHTVTASETRDGLTGSASVSFTLDTTAPATPAAPTLTSDTGASNTDRITSNGSVTYPSPASGDVLLYTVDGGASSTTPPSITTDGQHTVSVREEDVAGNVSAASSLTFTLDTTAPGAPAVVLAHDTGASASDRVTNDASVSVTIAAGSTAAYSLDGAAPTGSYEPSRIADGQHTLTVTQRDAAGNVSAASSLTFTLDTTAPAAPAAPTLVSDTGASATDRITSNATLKLPTAAAGDTLLYKVDGGQYGTAVPTVTGDGQHTVSVVEQDLAGNVSAASSLTFTLDTTAPAAPAAPTLASDTGASATDRITSNATLKLPTAAAGDTLLYKVDGGQYGTAVPTVTGDGQHTVSVVEQDLAGNVSAASSLTFTLDTTAPAAPAAPTLASDTGASATDRITSNATLKLPTAAAGDTLLYKVDGGQYGTAVPTVTGDGQHTVSVVEQDLAGNVSAASSLTFTLDTTAPAAPAAPTLASDTGASATDRITSNATLKLPTAAAGDTLLYKVDGGTYGTAAPTVTGDGQHTVSVVEQDLAGNVSAASSLTFTLDTTVPAAPAAPTLASDTGVSATDRITSNATLKLPTAAAGDTLLYKVDGGQYGTAVPTVTGDGQHTVSVVEQDLAGNVSAASSLAFTLDTTAPVVTVAPPPDHVTASSSSGAAVSFSATAKDAVDGSDPVVFREGNTTVQSGSVFSVGSHTVVASATDVAGNTGAQSFSFSVDGGAPANSPPVAASDSVSLQVHAVATGNVLSNDRDPDAGDTLHVASVTFANHPAVAVPASGTTTVVGEHGSLQIGADGQFSYAGSIAGAESFTVTVADSHGATASSLLTANVAAAATAPPSDETFNFAFATATLSYLGHDAILTGQDGVAHDVTGVGHLHFTDGTIDEADGQPLVDDLFYYANNKDVWAAHLDADAHYNQYGWQEGRDPNPLFSTSGYLQANPDVKAAGVNPLQQYDQYGWHEGRTGGIGFSADAYLLFNSDVKAAGVDPLAHALQYGASENRVILPGETTAANGDHLFGDFDATYYLKSYADVAAAAKAAGGDPDSFALLHYLQYGAKEGRDPDPYFSTSAYLKANPDVAAAGLNPLVHYELAGSLEGRSTSGFNTDGYLAANPDVAAAHVDPLHHFLQYGMAEGRTGWQV